MATPEARFLTLGDLADRFQVPLETVRYWRKHGQLPPAHMFGRSVRFSVRDVERWEAAQREAS